MSGAYLLYSSKEFQIWCVNAYWMAECHVPFSGHCDLDLALRIIVSGEYLLYYLRQESQIWCVCILGGGVSPSHTIFWSLWPLPSFRNNCVASIISLFEIGIPKLGVWMHLGIADCPIPFSGHFDLDLVSSLMHNFYILWGIPNLVCGCILGLRCRIPFLGHCDLDLVFFRIIVSRAFLLYYMS